MVTAISSRSEAIAFLNSSKAIASRGLLAMQLGPLRSSWRGPWRNCASPGPRLATLARPLPRPDPVAYFEPSAASRDRHEPADEPAVRRRGLRPAAAAPRRQAHLRAVRRHQPAAL